jgi:hypothetical protein
VPVPARAPLSEWRCDVRPAQFPAMPEVQLARRLHCVPVGRKGIRGRCCMPTLYKLGNLF